MAGRRRTVAPVVIEIDKEQFDVLTETLNRLNVETQETLKQVREATKDLDKAREKLRIERRQQIVERGRRKR